MQTSLKTGFAQIFSCCPKTLSCPNFGGTAAPLAPPARTPMYSAIFFSVLFSNILQSKAGYFCTFNSPIPTAAKNSTTICQKSAKSLKATEVSHLFPPSWVLQCVFFFLWELLFSKAFVSAG